MKYVVLMVGCLMVLAGCEAERDPSSLFGPDASGVLVVDALLIVDKPLPRVLISETVNATSRDRFGSLENRDWKGVGDAEVVISQGEQTFVYRPSSGFFAAGSYRPPPSAPLVFAKYNVSFARAITGQGDHRADGHAR